MRSLLLLLPFLLLDFTNELAAEAPSPVPVAVLVDPESTLHFKMQDTSGLTERRTVVSDKPEFKDFVEVHVRNRPKNSWDIQLKTDLCGPIHKGDVLLLSVWMRCLKTSSETGEGRVGLVVEGGPNGEQKLLDLAVSAGSEWRHFNHPFVASMDMPQGSLRIRVGALAQFLQVGGVSLSDYQQTRTVDQLPQTEFTYIGREPDAAWRKAAAERIERLRKGDLVVKVVDAQGKPVPDATVEVAMQRHAFKWGTSVGDKYLLDPGASGDRYRKILAENFNFAVPSNALKWGAWDKNRARALESVAKLHEMGIPVKAHNLIWPSWQGYLTGGWAYLPRNVFDLRNQPEKLRQTCYDHITDEVSALQGKVVSYDVINEPWANHDIMDKLGEREMAEWFRLARKADPKAKLILNEAITFDWGAGADNLMRIASDLDRQGAPLDALGIQAHYGSWLTPIESVYKSLDRFSSTGKTIEITEFDMEGRDRQLHADYLRDFMTIVFSHPAVTHFILWDFSDDNHWRKEVEPGLWDKDYRIKPAGEAYRDLVFRQFWSNAEGSTNANGVYRTRGFAGIYRIAVTHAGKTVEKTLDLPVTRAETTVTLD